MDGPYGVDELFDRDLGRERGSCQVDGRLPLHQAFMEQHRGRGLHPTWYVERMPLNYGIALGVWPDDAQPAITAMARRAAAAAGNGRASRWLGWMLLPGRLLAAYQQPQQCLSQQHSSWRRMSILPSMCDRHCPIPAHAKQLRQSRRALTGRYSAKFGAG